MRMSEDPVIEDYNWLVRHDPELHIRTDTHREWCEDPNCGLGRF